MPGYIRKFNIIVITVVLLSLIAVLAVPHTPVPYRLFEKENGKSYITANTSSPVADSVKEDAMRTAESLYGGNPAAVDDYFDQLVGIYQQCVNVQALVIFNAGGFGWDSVADAQGWLTVMEGIEDYLAGTGTKTLVVNFERTRSTLEGIISEATAFWGAYPAKSNDLAARISFLTRNLPDIKILLTGESNGATIAEETFRRLQDNPQVFAIQTGPTVIQHNIKHERSLVLRNNGQIDDSFSHGDVFTILRSNLEAAIGINQQYPGDILFYIGAPGHYYSWEFTEFRQEIINFLETWFSP